MSYAQRKTLKLAKLLTVVLVTTASAITFASEDLSLEGDEGPNSEFYSQAYSEKLGANNLVAKALSRKTKSLISAAHKAHTPKKLARYEDFNNRLREAVLDARKAGERKCQRLALKFQKISARASAVANCRTEIEEKIERDLQKLEIEFKRIAD